MSLGSMLEVDFIPTVKEEVAPFGLVVSIALLNKEGVSGVIRVGKVEGGEEVYPLLALKMRAAPLPTLQFRNGSEGRA